MNASELQQSLRRVLLARIAAGQLSGLGLARQVGFQQAHISNFLRGKRSLSIEGFDRLLAAQKLSVFDLVDREELNKRASSIAADEGEFENVVLVDSEVAAKQKIVTREAVRDVLKFKKAFLRRLRPAASPGRESWQRFLLIKVDAGEAAGMYPRLLPGATALIDRHYNTLVPYRRSNEPNLYAVRKDDSCTIRYVEREGDRLVLRPHAAGSPIGLLPLGKSDGTDLIVGRICHVGVET